MHSGKKSTIKMSAECQASRQVFCRSKLATLSCREESGSECRSNTVMIDRTNKWNGPEKIIISYCLIPFWLPNLCHYFTNQQNNKKANKTRSIPSNHDEEKYLSSNGVITEVQMVISPISEFVSMHSGFVNLPCRYYEKAGIQCDYHVKCSKDRKKSNYDDLSHNV